MTAALLGGCHCSRAPSPSTAPSSSIKTSDQALSTASDADAGPAIPAHVKGMWVWSTKKRLGDPNGTSSLLETVKMARLDEIYLSVNDGVLDDPRLPALMDALGAAGVKVEALAGQAAWYQPEKRAEVLALVDSVAAYNERNATKMTGVHLDIEPHQIPENKGNHSFLPALADTLRAARDHARAKNLMLSADLPRFAFEEQGALFAEAVPRLFVMLYQLKEKSSPWLVKQSTKTLGYTYSKVPSSARGRMVIGLRVEDYATEIDGMVDALDASLEGSNARYGGWAIHDEAKYRNARASRP